MTDIKGRKKISSALIIFSLVLLFNVGFGIIDFLPDFIAFIILYKQFKPAAERAPFFREATNAFRSLAIVNGAKIPVFILIAGARSIQTYGYDIYAVAAMAFGVFEIIYLYRAVSSIFDALFRLGERTDAVAFISPITVTKDNKMSPETFRVLTFIFVFSKTVFQYLPELFRLTQMTDLSSTRAVSAMYPIVFLICQTFGLIIGIFWLIVSIKYVNMAKKEGQYENSIYTLGGEGFEEKLANKEKISALKSLLTFMCITSIFSLDIKFDNTDNINLLPHTVYGILLVVFAVKIYKYTSIKHTLRIIIPAALYSVCSVFYYIFETEFLYYHGYDSLLNFGEVPSDYIRVEILSVIETVLLTVTLVMIAVAIHAYIFKHTGLPRDDENYSQTDRKYHRSLLIGNYVLMSLGILGGVGKCFHTFSKASQTLATFEMDFSTYATILPKVEWISLASAVCTIAYIAYSFYYTSTLKDEVEMKYNEE